MSVRLKTVPMPGRPAESTWATFPCTGAMVRAQTQAFLPDVLVYDPSAAGGYPNGRRLTDDVVDPMIAIVTMGRLTTDGVGPHAEHRSPGYH